MKNNLTEIIFILDKSGSMSGLEADTIGGFNAMLKKQKAETGDAVITTVLFDDRYQLLHDRINIKGVKPITAKDYYVEGSTALLDAIGKTINKAVNVQRNSSATVRADKVMFIITTDGMENASREYSLQQINQMIKHQTDKYNWEFIFLGANIDAEATAQSYGIRKDRAVNYHADSLGTEVNYMAMSEAISDFRANRMENSRWRDEIDKDFEDRK